MTQSARLFVDTSGWAAPLVPDTPHFAEMEANDALERVGKSVADLVER